MGRYDNLYPSPGRILRAWGIGVVDALNELYGWMTDGTHDINVKSVYAIYGNFVSRPYAEGRPVILDGDPISIYQFYDIAKQQITEAIDNSRATADLDIVRQYVSDVRDVVVKLRMDEYGNVGVRIAEPLDEYGYVQTSIVYDRVNLAKESTLQNLIKYLIVEEKTRCWDVVVDDVFAIPEGSVWYVKSIYVTMGELYIDGTIKII